MNSGSMTLKARVVVQRRADYPTEPLAGCTVALLTQCPPPEGGPLQEVEAAGYARQPIRFSGPFQGLAAGRALRSENLVSFVPCLEWPQAAYAGILDAEGNLIGYGRLYRAPGHWGVDEVSFAPTAIELQYR